MKKQHYFLISGRVIFQAGENTGDVTLNGIVVNDTRNFPARLIGKAQQVLQVLFFKKIDPTGTNVIDVPINSVSYLGHMTEKEFHAAPEGMTLQEKVSTADPFGDGKPSTVVDLTGKSVN